MGAFIEQVQKTNSLLSEQNKDLNERQKKQRISELIYKHLFDIYDNELKRDIEHTMEDFNSISNEVHRIGFMNELYSKLGIYGDYPCFSRQVLDTIYMRELGKIEKIFKPLFENEVRQNYLLSQCDLDENNEILQESLRQADMYEEIERETEEEISKPDYEPLFKPREVKWRVSKQHEDTIRKNEENRKRYEEAKRQAEEAKKIEKKKNVIFATLILIIELLAWPVTLIYIILASIFEASKKQ